jgi:hypothetical protein
MKDNRKNFLIRDKYSKAILLTNIAEVNEYKLKKENKDKILSLQNEIMSLKEQIKEIRNLLINRN